MTLRRDSVTSVSVLDQMRKGSPHTVDPALNLHNIPTNTLVLVKPHSARSRLPENPLSTCGTAKS